MWLVFPRQIYHQQIEKLSYKPKNSCLEYKTSINLDLPTPLSPMTRIYKNLIMLECGNVSINL